MGYIFATDMASTFKLATMILPQLETGNDTKFCVSGLRLSSSRLTSRVYYLSSFEQLD